MAENFLPDSSPSPPPSHFSRPLLAGLLCLWLCLLSQDVCFVSVSLYFFSHGRVMFTFYMKLALVLFNIILCPSINDCSFFKLNLLQFERHPYFLLPSLPPQIQQHQLHQLQFRHLHPQYQRWKPTAAWAPRPLLFSCPQTSSITIGGDMKIVPAGADALCRIPKTGSENLAFLIKNLASRNNFLHSRFPAPGPRHLTKVGCSLPDLK